MKRNTSSEQKIIKEAYPPPHLALLDLDGVEKHQKDLS